MNARAEQILAQAKITPGLSAEQIQRIEHVVPFMNDEDLNQLKGMLDEIQTASIADMKQELEVRNQVAAKHEEYQADQARESRAAEEASERKTETAEAESLLKNI